MPEYGLCDKSSEDIEEEKFFQEQQAIFKAAEAAELESRRRQAAAEESIIRTAKMLSQMSGQLQQIQGTQEVEREARVKAEQRAEEASRKQIRENRLWQATLVIIGLLTLAATIFGVLK